MTRYPDITPHLSVTGAEKALEFYAAAFGARETLRLTAPDGAVVHAEMFLGSSLVTLGEAMPEFHLVAPDPDGPVPVSIAHFCDDVDALHAQALAAGATEVSPPTDQFHGDRVGVLRCPFGHRWNLATHLRDVPAQEQQRLLTEMMSG